MNNDLISLIFFGDSKYCQYLQRYTERLDLLGKKYEVLFWNISEVLLKKYLVVIELFKSGYNFKLEKLIDFDGIRKVGD